MTTIKELDAAYVANTYARFPLHLSEGEGSMAYDEKGNGYIDFGTGIAVSSFGISDTVWQKAVIDQVGRLSHTSNLYYNGPSAELAALLCEKSGMKKVFFSNSGAESNECAIKAARLYGETHKGPSFTNIITLKNSFHGRTITTLSATGQDTFHQNFLPMTAGFYYGEAENIDSIKQLIAEHDCCAIMFELVQGEGGVIALSQSFVSQLTELAEAHQLLLIVDEVQTGNGRTGTLFSYMQYGFTPDIVSTAKGLGGGLPIGATLLGEKVKDVFTPGTHGSTFGGNPICCAGALSILSRIDDKLLAEVQKKSAYLISQLTGAPGVKSVSGLGLMLGIETERDAGTIISECMQHGLLVLKAKSKVRLLPALNIPWDLLEQGTKILKQSCAGQLSGK